MGKIDVLRDSVNKGHLPLPQTVIVIISYREKWANYVLSK